MSRLDDARKAINDIDQKMAELFCRRMEAAGVIAAHKKEHGLPILDPVREREVIARNSRYVTDPILRDYYVNFIENTMTVSRAYQSRLLDGMRIAYSGTVGAFAHIAAGKIFGCGTRVPFDNFKAAYEAVVNGDCDCAVLPLENSYAGEVGQVIDMLFSGPLFVSGVYDLPVIHDLVAIPGASRDQIQTVVSHPQALSQCANYLSRHSLAQREYENTAMAAAYVAESGDPTLAAICSEECAALFGLQVLERHINESRSNTTRFGVFTRTRRQPMSAEKEAPENRFILMFTVRHEAGSLAQAINIIGRYGFNMTSLRSRPMKELLWNYYFYVECEGTLSETDGQAVLDELSCCCDRLKLAGAYQTKVL
ncbi:MAG: bifunctional chorismate mutase/prephenate dehydratase [Ruminococcaceae bacterium]|nr:bifunctional chorismate mutase/prephenate dehydratase [Oscillospiraceae bacterium]